MNDDQLSDAADEYARNITAAMQASANSDVEKMQCLTVARMVRNAYLAGVRAGQQTRLAYSPMAGIEDESSFKHS